MGYNVQITKSTCKLPLEHAAEAYKRMCELNKRNDLKTGGSYPRPNGIEKTNTPNPHIWFAWMDWDYPETCKDAQDILNALGFETELTDTDILITGYDSKTGAERIFLDAIADLLKGAIGWQGEDGALWGWKFGGRKMKELEGTILYR